MKKLFIIIDFFTKRFLISIGVEVIDKRNRILMYKDKLVGITVETTK